MVKGSALKNQAIWCTINIKHCVRTALNQDIITETSFIHSHKKHNHEISISCYDTALTLFTGYASWIIDTEAMRKQFVSNECWWCKQFLLLKNIFWFIGNNTRAPKPKGSPKFNAEEGICCKLYTKIMHTRTKGIYIMTIKNLGNCKTFVTYKAQCFTDLQ